MNDQRSKDQNDLYAQLDRLIAANGGLRTLAEPRPTLGWPTHGVYFFFEPGETRRDGRPRVVRVGTHALTGTSRTTLWGRLSQHRGPIGGLHPGGGNHRGSIFRSHIGAALIRHEDLPDELLQSWQASNASPTWTGAEATLEVRVSHVIRAMPFTWLAVPTHADGTSLRGWVERNCIGLLSALTGPTDPPSAFWLGRSAARAEITQSGLWNVNHVHDSYDPAILDVVRQAVPSAG